MKSRPWIPHQSLVARAATRAASSTPILPVSLVIPVRNEARNIAWVLEQIADDVSEVILVDGNSTDATLIHPPSQLPPRRTSRR